MGIPKPSRVCVVCYIVITLSSTNPRRRTSTSRSHLNTEMSTLSSVFSCAATVMNLRWIRNFKKGNTWLTLLHLILQTFSLRANQLEAVHTDRPSGRLLLTFFLDYSRAERKVCLLPELHWLGQYRCASVVRRSQRYSSPRGKELFGDHVTSTQLLKCMPKSCTLVVP